MSLQDILMADLQEAMKQRNAIRRETIRLVRSAVKNAEIEKGAALDDSEILGVIAKQVRQRQESIAEFQKGNRQDLVAKEEAEMNILKAYLPAQLSREELVQAAQRVIAEVGARGPADKGKVMPKLMAELRGKADGREINAVVTELLSR